MNDVHGDGIPGIGTAIWLMGNMPGVRLGR